MSFIQRYHNTTTGALTFTGNTLGLSCKSNNPNPGNAGTAFNMGAFISLDNTQNVPTYPIAANGGSTLSYLKNGSAAQLVIPAGSTILYAELIWGGLYANSTGSVAAKIGDSINFTTPSGTFSISPDPATASTIVAVNNPYGNCDWYDNSANVTSLVASAGAGTYSTSAVPLLIDPYYGTSRNESHGGWTLAVAYSNPTLPVNYITIYAGGFAVHPGTDFKQLFTGFTTPAAGAVYSRMLFSVGAGDMQNASSVATGQTIALASLVTAGQLKGPYNRNGEFFGSIIADDAGNLNTTGTYGNLNVNYATQSIPTAGSRVGWDITNVSGANDTGHPIGNGWTTYAAVMSGLHLNVNGLGFQIPSQAPPSPQLSVIKSVDKTTANVGDTLTYTIVANNIGNASTGNVQIDSLVIKDTIPSGTTLVPGSLTVTPGPLVGDLVNGVQIGSLVAGATSTITFQVTVNIGVADATALMNTATDTYKATIAGVTTSYKGTSNAITTITDMLQKVKTVDKTTATLGDVLTYTIVATNEGNVPLNTIVIKDTIPAGTTLVPGSLSISPGTLVGDLVNGVQVATLAAGASITLTFQVTVDAGDIAGSILPNFASSSYSAIIGGATYKFNSNSNTVDTTVLIPASTIVKSVDKAVAAIGETLTYTVVATNTGNVDLSNYTITDILPADTTYVAGSLSVSSGTFTGSLASGVVLGTLAVGAVKTLTFKATVNTGTPAATSLDNTATSAYSAIINGVPIPKTKTSNTVSTIVEIPNLTVAKSVDNAVAAIGDTLTYTVVVTNTGNTPLDAVVAKDLIPSDTTLVAGSLSVTPIALAGDLINGVQLGTIAIGASVTITFKVTVNAGTPAATSLDNKATVAYTDTINGVTTSYAAISNIVSTIVEIPSFTIVKSVDKTVSVIGDTLTYTIVTTNTGNVALNGVTITDLIPADTTYVAGSLAVTPGTFTGSLASGVVLGTMAIGAVETITFKVTVNTGTPAATSLDNTATGAGSALINNVLVPIAETSNTVHTTVVVPELTVVKSVDQAIAATSNTLTYTVVVTNAGNIVLNNVTITDILPSDTAYVAGSLTVLPGTFTGNLVSGVVLGTMAVGEVKTLTFKAIISNSATIGESLDNTAIAAYTALINGVTSPYNTPSNIVSTVIQMPIISIVKAVDKVETTLGDTLTYTVTVTNNGTLPLDNLVVTDIVPTYTTYVNGSLTVTPGIYVGDLVNGIQLGTLTVGSTVTLTFKVTVNNNAPSGDILENFANASGTSTVNEVTTQYKAVSNLKQTVVIYPNFTGDNFVKSSSKAVVGIGDQYVYNFAITNPGNVEAVNVIFSDTLQSDISFVPSTVFVDGINYPAYDPQSGFNLGTIGVGTTVNISFTVQVNTIPISGFIYNYGIINYDYYIASYVGVLPVDPSGTAQSNTNVVTVSSGYVNPNTTTKTADKTSVVIGDTITYTVSFTNTGNEPLTKAFIIDNLQTGLTFVPQSVVINGVPDVTANIATGLTILNILPNKTETITFKVSVGSNVVDPIKNTVNIQYYYDVNGNTESKNVNTNTVTIPVKIPQITITKSASPLGANVGDTITYTLLAENTGNVNIDNVVIVDKIPNGTTFVPGSLTVAPGSIVGDLTNGLQLGTIVPGAIVTVTFKVTINNDLPSGTVIQNQAISSFTSTINGVTSNHSQSSNPISTTVAYPDFSGKNFVKSVDKTVVKVGDEIVYSFAINNGGNVDALNIFFQDILQTENIFVPQSLYIDGINYPSANPEIGFTINSIPAGTSGIISFTAKVVAIPNPNIINNKAVMTYQFTSITGGTLNQSGAQSNVTEVTVINPSLSIVKSVNVTTVVVGDTVEYKLKITNNGNITLNNVMIKDLLAPELQFVTGSVIVDGVAKTTDSILTGINIGTMNLLQTVTITFKVTVIALGNGKIPNISTAYYSYAENPDGQQNFDTQNSNQVILIVENANLLVEKTSDVTSVELNGTITYTVKITNNGDVDATQVTFIDNISTGTTLVGNQITVNGVQINGVNLSTGIDIGGIPAGGSATIVYTVTVVNGTCNGFITNDAYANFVYILADGTEGHKTSNTASVSVVALIQSFKQIVLDKCLCVPQQKPDMEGLNEVIAEVEITNCYPIKTVNSVSNEGQILSGNKLIVNGIIKISTEYTACVPDQAVHSAHYSINFGSFIILPIDFDFDKEVTAIGLVEGINSNMMDARNIFVNLAILLIAKNEY